MSRLTKAIIVGLLTGIVGLAISRAPFGHYLEEYLGLGLLFRMRGTREVPSDVVIVTINKASADNLNMPMDLKKWPRSLHARLIENLVREDAAVIGFDIFFKEARIAEDDNLFAEAIGNAGNVVLFESIKQTPVNDKEGALREDVNKEILVPPVPVLAQSAVALAPFPLPKVPLPKVSVRVSQYWTFKRSVGDVPTLPVVVYQIFALQVYDDFIQLMEKVSPSQAGKLPPHKDAIIKTKSVNRLILDLRNIFQEEPLIAEKMLEKLQNSRTPSDDVKKNQILKSLIRVYQSPESRYLNFYGPPGTITTVPYYRVLQSQDESAAVEMQLDLSGKAVFVGHLARWQPEQRDCYNTVFSQASGLDICGTEFAATAFANILEDMSVQPLGDQTYLTIIFLWGILLGIICRFFSTFIAALSMLGLSIFYLIAILYQFKNTGVWYPLVLPLFFQVPFAFFGTILWKYSDAGKERQHLRDVFANYLPEKVVDQLAKSMVDVTASGQMVYGTCLYTDAEKYSTLSEKMDPDELGRLLNRYYEIIFKPVKQHGGFVSDVKGDSMLALWTTAHADAAYKNEACLAALDINSAIQRLNQSSGTSALPTRIGLHSGQVLVGSVGAIDHYEYRAVGDIVNTTTRLEGLNKYLGTRILVSEEVLYQLSGFLTRELGKFLLVGKSKPVVVHELICRMEESDGRQRSLCAIFSDAFNAYRSRSWEEAVDKFYESMKVYSEDGPSLFYLKLCEKYRENPPEEMWDGLIRLDTK